MATCLRKDFAAVHNGERDGAQPWHAVVRQLDGKGRRLAAHDGGAQQQRRDQRGEQAGQVQRHHGDGLQTDDAAQQRARRDERGNEQRIDRQARRAGHERCDEDGCDAIAARRDGARGHDGRDRARVGGQQREKGASVQTDAAHGAVGDDGGAGHVAAVLKHGDDQEHAEDLRKKAKNRGNAVPDAVDDDGAQDGVGKEGTGPGSKIAQPVGERLARRVGEAKDDLKGHEQEGEAEDGAGDRVQRPPVHGAGDVGVLWAAVGAGGGEIVAVGLAACGVATGLQNGKNVCGCVVLVEPVIDRLNAGTACRADECRGGVQLARHGERIDKAFALLQLVSHVDEQHCRQLAGKHLANEQAVLVKLRAVHDQKHGIELWKGGLVALKDCDGDPLIL